MTLIEKIIIAAIVAIVAILALASISWLNSAEKFKNICDAAGGKTVFDGRQYQCIQSK